MKAPKLEGKKLKITRYSLLWSLNIIGFEMHAQLLFCLFYHWMTAWQLLNGAENLEWTTEPYIGPHLMEPGGSCWSKNVQLFFSCHVRATEKSTDPNFPTFMIWWRNVSYSNQPFWFLIQQTHGVMMRTLVTLRTPTHILCLLTSAHVFFFFFDKTFL